MNTFRKTSIILFILMFNRVSAQNNNSGVEPFLPEIFSQYPGVRDIAISSEEDELYFTIQSYAGELSAIVFSKKEKGVWTCPEVVSFSGKHLDLEPFLSPDGLRLFFSSNRPLSADTGKMKDFDIWYVERKHPDDKWSEPINIGAPINTSANEFFPSISRFNNLYFTCENELSKSKEDIFVSKWEHEKYQIPLSLSDSINSEGMEFNAFIAPDESFLIYSCYNRKEGLGSGDLYISYNKGNDLWTKAKNLGASINCLKMDYCPFVNVKTNTLYFTARRNSVETNFESKQNVQTLLKEMQKYENGLSRIYKVKLILDQ